MNKEKLKQIIKEVLVKPSIGVFKIDEKSFDIDGYKPEYEEEEDPYIIEEIGTTFDIMTSTIVKEPFTGFMPVIYSVDTGKSFLDETEADQDYVYSHNLSLSQTRRLKDSLKNIPGIKYKEDRIAIPVKYFDPKSIEAAIAYFK